MAEGWEGTTRCRGRGRGVVTTIMHVADGRLQHEATVSSGRAFGLRDGHRLGESSTRSATSSCGVGGAGNVT